MLIFLLTLYTIHLVASQTIRITQHPANITLCEGSNAILSCVIYDNSTINAANTTSWFTNGNPTAAVPSNMITNTRDDDMVTSVLTIESVSLNDNGNGYFCVPTFPLASDVGVILVSGPPGVISDVDIPPDTITACSFVVQWNRLSSDPVCGPVQYTVSVTEGGVLIITDTTILTQYYVTGLNANTTYHVNVTASNNAGSSSSVSNMRVMTNSNGLPFSPPEVTIKPLSNTSFTVSWIISDPNYNYTVTWTNLNTGVMDNYTVAENTNSHTVTGLSDYDNYNVTITDVGVCGMITSDPITLYAYPPNQPQFEYCISYNDEQPALQVISHVIVDTPRMSLSLTFSASYQTGNSGNSNSQSATCSSLSNMQYNCTAKFAVNVIPSNVTIDSVNVIVNGSYGNASSRRNVAQRVNAILNVEVINITEDSATLNSKMPCFSSDLLCAVSNLTTNDMSVTMENLTDIDNGLVMAYNYLSHAIQLVNDNESVMAYSYPNHTIQLIGLNRSTTYNCCVIAVNNNTRTKVGEPMCRTFTTIRSLYTKDNDDTGQWFYGVAAVAALLISSILFCIIAFRWCKGGKSNKSRYNFDTTPRKSVAVSAQLENIPTYDCPRGTDDDNKRTVAETQIEESPRNDGTIKDDKIQFVSPNVQNGRELYDRLASESDRTVASEDIGVLATTEGELSSEMLCYQVNDTNELHGDTIDTASKEPGAVVVQLGDNPTYDWPRGSGDDKRRTDVETQKEESIRNDRDTIDAASNEPVAMAVQLGDNPTYGWPRGPGDAETRTGVETQKEESIINELYYHIDEAPRGQLEQQPPLNAATSLPTTNEAALANSSAAKKPPGKINFYDPIQKHSSAIPHLNTSSGDKYALPASKTSRASKQSDKVTTDKQKLPHYAVSSKSKKAASQRTQHTDLSVNSPASDESKGLIGQMARNTDSEIPPLPASKMIPIEEGPNMYAKIA